MIRSQDLLCMHGQRRELTLTSMMVIITFKDVKDVVPSAWLSRV